MAGVGPECPYHSMVANIKSTISEVRPARPIDKSLRAEFRQPGGPPVERGLEELTEEYRRSPEFQRMAGGAVLAVPVCELRVMELPALDCRTGEYTFKKGKRQENWIDSEGMWTTMENIKDRIETEYKTLESQGVDAKSLIKKRSEYNKFNSFQDQQVEVIAKYALQATLEGTQKPALLIRGLKLNKSTIKYMQKLGVLLEMPNDDKGKIQDWEGDLVAAVVGKYKLHIILGEVKRKNFSPFKTGKQDMRELIRHALNQLKKDVRMIKAVLSDFPDKRLKFHFLAFFPETEKSEVDTSFCGDCLSHVVWKDDLTDSNSLQQKLGLQDDDDFGYGDGYDTKGDAMEVLLALATRTLSLLTHVFIGHRKVEDLGKVEEARMGHSVKKVDKKQYVMLDQDMKDRLAHASKLNLSLAVTGGSGAGKTVVLSECIKNHDSDVLVVSSYDTKDGAHLLGHLKEVAEEQKDDKEVKVLPWEQLLQWLAIDKQKYRGKTQYISGKFVNDLPSLICAICGALAKVFPGKKVLFILDEVWGIHSPLTSDRKPADQQQDQPRMNDWDGLTKVKLPDDVFIALAINPNHKFPLKLEPSPDFTVVECKKRYRNTKTLIQLEKQLASEPDIPVQEREDEPATDIEGSPATVVDLGEVTDRTTMEKGLRQMVAIFTSEGRKAGVMVHYGISPESVKLVAKVAADVGWTEDKWDMFKGWEADSVIAVGPGHLETISRARLRLGILHCWEQPETYGGKGWYEKYQPALRKAEQKRLLTYLAPEP